MWVEADSPWQFLAWCQEWRAFKQQGMGFVTHIPVGLDGSCNGLQHFSAMLRDEAGAEAVNLIPNEKPADIYQRVCDGVKADLLAMLPTGRGKRSEEAVFAKKFLEWDKTTRKLTKRPVMIVPYGGTTRATFKYTLEYLNEHKDAPFKDNYKAAQFVSKVIWDNVAKETQSAQQVMKWLQGIARNMSKEDSTIEWTTPSGFVVSMANLTTYDKFLEVKLFDRRYQVKLKEYAQTIDSNQQVSGISPNFVHALDASALVFYVMRAKAQGIPNLALIHDSYGTTADQTELASQLLREAFVQLYAEHDVLAEFKSQMPVGMAKEEPPSQGGFDINQVLSADYFFA
jgi:DNA-directed RNA polymerase